MLQAAYHSSKPAVFGQHLKGVGLDDEKCEIFQHIWSEKAKSVLAQLRKKSIAAQQVNITQNIEVPSFKLSNKDFQLLASIRTRIV